MSRSISAGFVQTRPPEKEDSSSQSLGLPRVEQLGIERLVSGDPSGVVEHARALAEALAGPEHDQVRLRTLSRSIAVGRTQQALLEGMLLERLSKRDEEGVELIDKVLRGVVGRLSKMLEAHRLESSLQQRVTVQVAHADDVHIDGVGE